MESVPRRRFQEATFDRGNARGTESLQTRRWSKPDSNCRSHLLEHMELQADAVTAKVGHVASFAFFDGLLARCL